MRDVVDVEGFGEHGSISDLPAGVGAEEAAQLALDTSLPLSRLSLEDPERAHFSLRFDDALDPLGAE
jgi:hypothetical protein